MYKDYNEQTAETLYLKIDSLSETNNKLVEQVEYLQDGIVEKQKKIEALEKENETLKYKNDFLKSYCKSISNSERERELTEIIGMKSAIIKNLFEVVDEKNKIIKSLKEMNIPEIKIDSHFKNIKELNLE